MAPNVGGPSEITNKSHEANNGKGREEIYYNGAKNRVETIMKSFKKRKAETHERKISN